MLSERDYPGIQAWEWETKKFLPIPGESSHAQRYLPVQLYLLMLDLDSL